MNNFKCPKCDTLIEVGNQAHSIRCPKCKKKYINTKDSGDLIWVKNQLVRKYPKVKMSKKQRLRERRFTK